MNEIIETSEDGTKPWHRMPDEEWIQYHAFSIYRDLPPKERRDIIVARKIGKSGASVHNWRKKWKWEERTVAYLMHKAEENKLYEQFQRAEMNQRHADICAEGIEQLAERIKTIDPSQMSVTELTRLLDTLFKNERLARGATTEIVKSETHVSGTITNNENITQNIVVDPEASKLACELLEKLKMGKTLENVKVIDHKPLEIEHESGNMER